MENLPHDLIKIIDSYTDLEKGILVYLYQDDILSRLPEDVTDIILSYISVVDRQSLLTFTRFNGLRKFDRWYTDEELEIISLPWSNEKCYRVESKPRLYNILRENITGKHVASCPIVTRVTFEMALHKGIINQWQR